MERSGLRFVEAMAGTWRRRGEDVERPIAFEAVVTFPSVPNPLGTARGELRGVLRAADLARASRAVGSIELSPVRERALRYRLDLTGDDGRPYRVEGRKSIDWLRPVPTWTTMPATIADGAGTVVGTATLRFAKGDVPALIMSMRPAGRHPARRGGGKTRTAVGELERRRWDGRRGRLEVWYDTFTDPRTGDGFWLHHELVAPLAGVPYAHGWVAAFPADAAPAWERFGPHPVAGGEWFEAGPVRAAAGLRRGEAGSARWELRYEDGSDPLFTFPAAAWRRELLPSSQVVASPAASFSGTLQVGGRTFELEGARGAAARIYGRGNAQRWAWLHADLGHGDVLEVVAAVGRRPALRHLPPAAFVRLRAGGLGGSGELDWPRSSLAAAPRFGAHLGAGEWSVRGRVGSRRLQVSVRLPPERCVVVGYTDPDGESATCTNTERADAHVVVEADAGGRWEVTGDWDLRASAHSELGTRP